MVLDKVKPEEIWITTYTEKAANQLRAKIASSVKELNLNLEIPKLLIGTIHSTCLRLIQDYPEFFPNVRYPITILDSHKQLLYFVKNSKRLGIDKALSKPDIKPSLSDIQTVIDHINWLSEYQIEPKEYENLVRNKF